MISTAPSVQRRDSISALSMMIEMWLLIIGIVIATEMTDTKAKIVAVVATNW